MQILYTVLLVLHITSAAILFGTPIGLTKNLRKNLGADVKTFRAITDDSLRRASITGLFAIATLVTGLALIFTLGGFGAVKFTIHIALTLMLIAFAISATMLRPPSAKLAQLAQAETLDQEAAKKAIRVMTIGQGILHLLWLVILVLMVTH